MFVKNMKLPILLDVYGALLTERQYELLDLYYNEDLSLSEIAENTGLSRQGVRDAVKKAENELSGFEDKLGFVEKKEETDRLLAEAERIAKELPDELSVELLKIISELSAAN
ncbi:MAG: winged helix-turn-helix transcriptional regulator [Clostridia bacterium]|nr:winged helix-turn-helix transcriptional regulator [Clostridia bacterium]MBQ9544504.1 winged helix-turn-helix transcriptional regulator [Clostridia bacterium]